MKSTCRTLSILIAVVVAAIHCADAASPPQIQITDMRIKSGLDSAGQRIVEIALCTCQKRVPMWGTLTVYVQMQDKSNEVYFGSASLRQLQRSSGTTSAHTWVFHALTAELDHPQVTGVWAVYRNQIDAENYDDKKKFVKTKNLEEWVKSNAEAKKLMIRNEVFQ